MANGSVGCPGTGTGTARKAKQDNNEEERDARRGDEAVECLRPVACEALNELVSESAQKCLGRIFLLFFLAFHEMGKGKWHFEHSMLLSTCCRI